MLLTAPLQFIVLLTSGSVAVGYIENIPYLLLVLFCCSQKGCGLCNMFPLTGRKEELCP